MPEMDFEIEWPTGEKERFYSPSYVIEDYLAVGQSYTVDEFLERACKALRHASERVRARYGTECSSALDQWGRIAHKARSLPLGWRQGRVAVIAFDKHPPRDARVRPQDGDPPVDSTDGSRQGRTPTPGVLAVRSLSGGRETRDEESTMTPHHSVIVIGAGQAGLSASFCLKEQGIEHVVVEKSRIGSSWRTQRWDTFCLVTPNWQCQLPGHPYNGSDPHGFMGKDEIVGYIDSYAARFDPPVLEGVEVLSLRLCSTPGARFELESSLGPMTADHVIVATGAYHVPRIPAIAAGLPEDIVQIHSAHYRNPDQLPRGDVLVVGTGQSGCQIAEDLHLARRKVHLCVGNAPRCARRHRGKDVVEWLHLMGYYDIPIEKHPNREQVRDRTNHYVTGRDGGHDIDLRRFALEGMRLYGPLKSIRAGRFEFESGLKRNLDDADDVYRRINRSIDAFIEKEGFDAPVHPEYTPTWEPVDEPRELDAERHIGAVVWCIGFSSDFRWIHAPVFDESWYPVHERGVTTVDGLYFIGLPWLYTWGSGRFSGVGRDARHLVSCIMASAGVRARVSALS